MIDFVNNLQSTLLTKANVGFSKGETFTFLAWMVIGVWTIILFKMAEQIKTEEGWYYEFKNNEFSFTVIVNLMLYTILSKLSLGLVDGNLWILLIPLLTVQVAIDRKYMELADEFTVMILALGLWNLVYYHFDNYLSTGLVTLGIFILFFLFWLFSDGLGYGDVKLVAALGWFFLTGMQGISFIYFACISGAISGVWMLIQSFFIKEKNRPSEFAFGPYLVASFILVNCINSPLSLIYS